MYIDFANNVEKNFANNLGPLAMLLERNGDCEIKP